MQRANVMPGCKTKLWKVGASRTESWDEGETSGA